MADWRFITKFLENADNLEVLKISFCFGNLKCRVEPKQVPACLVSRLGIVEIKDFNCTEQEFNMVRYILRNAQVLKKMEIYCLGSEISWKKKLETHKELSLFEQQSEACELAFPLR
ncbi:probable fbd-associated F-box protein at1g32375 [Phtheirospermum japonicum]|uniref:Probable fbd-associated F-box protein at1g32375 n=1 Tax=Phtheirospermum japonicum TaxID=374723 RepID=A0A830BQG7_9LAMI|nr:probable fbd-associated F-box protein at1g32375 [Phtheirospermum japonicum]